MRKILASILIAMFICVPAFAQEAAEPEVKADISISTVNAAADIIANVSGDWQIVTFTENNVPVAEWIIDGGYIDRTGRQIDGNVTVTGEVEDGVFKGIVAFKNNEIVNGKYKFFYEENNYLHAEGRFLNSLKSGYWEYFHATGKKMANGDYTANIRTGYWSFYNEKGIKEDGGWFNNGDESRVHNIDNFDWLRKDIDSMKYKRLQKFNSLNTFQKSPCNI